MIDSHFASPGRGRVGDDQVPDEGLQPFGLRRHVVGSTVGITHARLRALAGAPAVAARDADDRGPDFPRQVHGPHEVRADVAVGLPPPTENTKRQSAP